jgi:hypothetical protein
MITMKENMCGSVNTRCLQSIASKCSVYQTNFNFFDQTKILCECTRYLIKISFVDSVYKYGYTCNHFSQFKLLYAMCMVRGVATVRHFRHVPTQNFFPQICLLMKNDKQRITYFNYVCFMFIVLMTSFHKLKDKHLQ